MKFKRNTQAIVRLAGEKSRRARLRVLAAITAMQLEGAPVNFNTICRAACVSKTFLYDPKHSDLAAQTRSLRQDTPQSTATQRESAKDAQFARFKERVRTLEEQVRSLQEENELLYGRLSERAFKPGEIPPAPP